MSWLYSAMKLLDDVLFSISVTKKNALNKATTNM